MDAILLAERLPRLGERAIRRAIVRAVAGLRQGPRRRWSFRSLTDDALLAFERDVARIACDGVRPGPLFAERDRILADLQRFAASRFAVRLFALHPTAIVNLGRAGAPFDAVVLGRSGEKFGLVLRRLPGDGRRLEAMRSLRTAALRCSHDRAIAGTIVYDFSTGRARTLRCTRRAIGSSAA